MSTAALIIARFDDAKVCDVLAKKLPRRGRAGQFFESKKCRAQGQEIAARRACLVSHGLAA